MMRAADYFMSLNHNADVSACAHSVFWARISRVSRRRTDPGSITGFF
jgi:hypothetical protein